MSRKVIIYESGKIICLICKLEKELHWFRSHVTAAGNTVYEKKCMPCEQKRNNSNLVLRRYGVTKQQIELMLKSQNGLCAICGQPPGQKGLGVDHCHETGKVRQLLCTKCNLILGFVGDDVELLKLAIAYLERHK
jgi:hypothetical protein